MSVLRDRRALAGAASRRGASGRARKGGGGAGIFRKKEDLEALRQMIVEVLEG